MQDQITMSDVDAAWLAALIDGEGSISSSRLTKSQGVRFDVSMFIGNTCVPLLDKAARLTGLRVYFCKRPGNGRPLYGVRAIGRSMVPILEAVQPWLIAKGDQSALALRLQSIQRRGNAFDPELLPYRERLWAAISDLNHGREADVQALLDNPVEPDSTQPRRMI